MAIISRHVSRLIRFNTRDQIGSVATAGRATKPSRGRGNQSSPGCPSRRCNSYNDYALGARGNASDEPCHSLSRSSRRSTEFGVIPKDLPPTLDANTTAELFGVSYWTLLRAVKAGTSPVEPLRVGRSLRFSTARVVAVLGIDLGPE